MFLLRSVSALKWGLILTQPPVLLPPTRRQNRKYTALSTSSTSLIQNRVAVQNGKNKIIFDEYSTSDQTIIMGLQIFLDQSLVQKNYTSSSTKLDTGKIIQNQSWPTCSNNEQTMQNSVPCWKEAEDLKIRHESTTNLTKKFVWHFERRGLPPAQK